MKKIIYNNPVVSAIIINIVTLLLLIYLINEKIFSHYMLPIITGVLNRKIMDNGQDINRRQKVMIFSSFLLVLIIYLIYSFYFYRIGY